MGWHRALRWTVRETDPNAGLVPEEDFDGEGTTSGYVDPLDAKNDHEEREWVADLAPCHIGGTMRPAQNVPEMSPFRIGFEEWLGGYNFGAGNAQLDVQRMIFDWAC